MFPFDENYVRGSLNELSITGARPDPKPQRRAVCDTNTRNTVRTREITRQVGDGGFPRKLHDPCIAFRRRFFFFLRFYKIAERFFKFV